MQAASEGGVGFEGWGWFRKTFNEEALDLVEGRAFTMLQNKHRKARTSGYARASG